MVMSTAKKAEECIKRYFKKERNIDFIKPKKGETGFDFRDDKSTIFIEAKPSWLGMNHLVHALAGKP